MGKERHDQAMSSLKTGGKLPGPTPWGENLYNHGF